MLTVKMAVRQKSAFAVQHLMAAARFSRMCGEVESRHAGESFGSFFDEEIAYVSATVMLATASLESNINEYLSEMDHFFPELSSSLRTDAYELLEKKSTLEKYQYAMSFKGKDKLPQREPPYQDASALITLRNALVHFSPEWDNEQEQHKKMGKILAGKFSLNPFMGDDGALFPYRCISYGCSQWAVTSALSFMKKFSEVSGLHRFEKFADRLNTEISRSN